MVRLYGTDATTPEARAPQDAIEERLMALLLAEQTTGVSPFAGFAASVNIALRFIAAANAFPEQQAQMIESVVLALGQNFGTITVVSAPDPQSGTRH